MQISNENEPAPGSVLEAVKFMVTIVNELEQHGEERFISTDAYSDVIRLQQANGILETIIMQSSVKGWDWGITVFQELFMPHKEASPEPEIGIIMYVVKSSGEVTVNNIMNVDVITPNPNQMTEITPDLEADLLLSLSTSTLMPVCN